MHSRFGGALTTFVAAVLASGNAVAWGPVGHETIAYIAEDNLTPAASAKVAEILGPDLDLASVANWADQVRATSRPQTASWHYIDIDDRALLTSKGDEPKFCKNHGCVVEQIQLEVGVLEDAEAKPDKKFEALKFLVHFVGDLHQPLHCANDSDRGGNDKLVRFITPGKHSKRGAKIKLHALWDHLIEIKTTEDPRELATALEGKITTAQKREWLTGAPADWAWETFGVARDSVYKGLQPGPTGPEGVPLPANYYATQRKVVDRQLERGGIRLAQILNDVLGH